MLSYINRDIKIAFTSEDSAPMFSFEYTCTYKYTVYKKFIAMKQEK